MTRSDHVCQKDSMTLTRWAFCQLAPSLVQALQAVLAEEVEGEEGRTIGKTEVLVSSC